MALLCPLARALGCTANELLNFRPELTAEEIDTLCTAARRQFEAGEKEQAAALCEERLRQYPTDLNLAFRVGFLYARYGGGEEALLKRAIVLFREAAALPDEEQRRSAPQRRDVPPFVERRNLLINVLAALLADADLAAVVVATMVHAGRLLALRANQHDVGDMDRSLNGHDAALGVLLGGTHGLLNQANLLDDDALLLRQAAEDLALLALVLAAEHLDGVALLNMHSAHFLAHLPYSVSGARDAIFRYFLSRSSRATGPNTRVPRGVPSLLIRTQAF